MKKLVVIKTSFAATHQWKECNIDEVAFLQFPHRHVFHVVLKVEITENNREIEFISLKNRVTSFLDHFYAEQFLGNRSCEDIAEELGVQFNATFVSVFEDDENGAEIYF